MKKYIYRHDGFTLTELMIAILIMALVMTGTVYIYLMSLSAWKEGSAQIMIQREASAVMEKMVRGVSGQNGIREASSVIAPTSDSIQYVSGVDGVERSFYLSGTDIIYDPDTSTASDEYSVAEYVSGLIFSVSGDVITVDLNMLRAAGRRDMTLSLSTVITLRN